MAIAPAWRDGRLAAQGPVALVGAGPAAAGEIDACLSRAVAVVAADGGAAALMAAGRVPDAVMGDLDSLPPGHAIPPDRLLRLGGQDDTDFEKCMDRIEAPLVLGAGFLGGRIDHALAALGALARRSPWGGPDRTGLPHVRSGLGVWPPCILVGASDLAFAVPRLLQLDLPPGCRVSLFPMAPVAARSAGLEWPLDGLALAPSGRVATSNRATGPVTLETFGPGLLCLLPSRHLDDAAAALAPGAPPR